MWTEWTTWTEWTRWTGWTKWTGWMDGTRVEQKARPRSGGGAAVPVVGRGLADGCGRREAGAAAGGERSHGAGKAAAGGEYRDGTWGSSQGKGRLRIAARGM